MRIASLTLALFLGLAGCLPAQTLGERGAENLQAFARMFGYVRYFHPSDEAAGTDWNLLATRGVLAVEGAAGPAQLAAALDSLFRPVAPTVEIRAASPGPRSARPRAVPAGDSLVVVSWRHVGIGTGDPRNVYSSERIRTAVRPRGDSVPDPARPLEVELGGGVHASIPLALYADARGTLPHRDGDATAAPPFLPPSAIDRATRLAAVVIAWNVFQHFYPYFDVVPAGWEGELPLALRSAAVSPDECEFVETLRHLVAALRDGHGSVYHRCEGDWRTIGADVEFVEGVPVITATSPGVPVLRPGDRVLRLDGRNADSLVAARAAFTPAATPQFQRVVIASRLFFGPPGSPVRMTVEHVGGDTASVELRRDEIPAGPRERKPAPVAELRPGTWYVDLDRVTPAQFQAALPDLERARGLVFDMRGYPRQLDALEFFSHLIREPATSPQWHLPVITRPDRVGMRFVQAPGWPLVPGAPYLDAPRVFITDGRAISYAESVMGVVEHYRLGEIVGEPTAGTNGNVNPIVIPGGYRINWTGMKVLKHDGSRHHGVGIHPTIPAHRTRAGVAAGRDELLERALAQLGGGA